MAKLQEYRPGKFRFKLRGKYFYLPGLAKRDAESVQEKVEKLASAKAAGSIISDRIALWLGESCPEDLYNKLVEVGLVEARAQRASCNLLQFVEAWMASRTDVKESTRRIWRQARDAWTERHDRRLNVRDVTAADAAQFRRSLIEAEYSEATVAIFVKTLRQFFSAAVDAELINRNPFAKVKAGKHTNEERQEFVERGDIARVLAKCPDAEFRLIVALSRYGGLRAPSETDALTWADIDHEEGEFVVNSPKTGKRVVPLFPELVEPLRDAYEAAPDGATHVIVRHRGSVRRQMGRIVDRAGVDRWPRIFHNLRASRETELMQEYPIHVVCKWIGNSPAIALRHYLQVMPSDMEKAKGRALVAPEENVAVSVGKQKQPGATRQPGWESLAVGWLARDPRATLTN